jgi:outer membrane protein insertion porin family
LIPPDAVSLREAASLWTLVLIAACAGGAFAEETRDAGSAPASDNAPAGEEDAPETRGPPLRSITFEGREVIPGETLLEVAGLRVGESWSEAAGVEAFRRLARWPYLASVEPPVVAVGPEGVDVVIRIREMLLAGTVRFTGNEVFADRDLRAASGLATGQPLRPEMVREAEAAVLARYHEDGFLLAWVEAEVEPATAGRADITFRVAEERRVHLSEVRLEGAEAIGAAEALSHLRLQPRRLLGLISRGHYVPAWVEEDLDRLRALYLSRGFLAAEVGFGGLDIDLGGRSARLTLLVSEGPRFRFRGARIEGHKSFPLKLLEREVALPPGGHYSEEKVQQAHLRLVRWYDEHSDIVPRIEVGHEYGEDHGVTVVFRIDESRRHVETGRVEIRGNRTTRDRVVREDIALIPGKHFTIHQLRRTREQLARRGYYDSVDIDASRGSDPSRPEVEVLDIEVTVTEKENMGMLLAGGGASSGKGEVAYFRLFQPNFDLFRLPDAWNDWSGAFRGGGQLLDLEVVPGTRESLYRLRFAEPHFLRSGVALALSGDTEYLDRPTYRESRFGGAVKIEGRLDDARRLSASLAYVADFVRIDQLDSDAPPDVVEAEGRDFLGYPRLEMIYDDRVFNFYSGPAGFTAGARLDIAGSPTGSSVDFARATANASIDLALFDERPDYRHALHIGVDVGWIEDLGSDEVPLYERFYLGGPRTFRGFEYRRLGPHQGRTPVGGGAVVHGTVEYSLPLFWREVRAVAVFDWGDLEPSFSELSGNRFRTAAGGGLIFRLTLLGQPFPAAIYWVKALASEPEDREELFSFTVGLGL